jgi:serine O-acetyltransferase
MAEKTLDPEALMRRIRARHPGLREAIVADARITAQHRFERHEFHGPVDTVIQVLRLMWVSDAFLAHALYRLKAALQRRGVPLLPRLAHKMAMLIAQVSIGDPVLMEPGVYIVHGQVVIDGIVEVRSGAIISPWVTVGLRAGDWGGPTIGPGVSIGTGAKVLGNVTVGAGARVGANAVVVNDVPEGATVVGIPAHQPRSTESDEPERSGIATDEGG